MKKNFITFIMSIMLVGFFKAQPNSCSAVNVPYVVPLDSAIPPLLPECTSVINYGSGNIWKTVSFNGNGFSGNILRYQYNPANPANTWFFSRGINLAGGTKYRIKYKFGNSGISYPEKLKVAYGISASESGMLYTLADHPNITNSIAVTNSVDFTPVSNGIYYLGFKAYSDANMNRLELDDISITVAPLCDEPLNVLVSNIGSTTASIQWAAPVSSPVNGYEYYVSDNNTSPGTATIPTGAVNQSSANLSNLNPGVKYYVWVRSVCSTTEKSIWTPVTNFLTECTEVSFFKENFDSTPMYSLPGCWKNLGASNYAGVLPQSVGTSPNSLYISTFLPSTGFISLPPVNTLQLGTHRLKFKVRADVTSGGTIEIGYLDSSNHFNVLTTYTSSSTTVINDFLFAIPVLPTGVNKLAIKHTGNPSYSILIDDIIYEESTSLAVKDAETKQFSIYPNPFKNVLNIDHNKNIRSIHIYDVSGKVVKILKNPSSVLNLEELSAGKYIFVIENDKEQKIINMIKQQ
ncbi:T9SS type A sorting domain-containing protein [Chryseobacterium sp. JK1]|uniref:T9SS type A sorting domain-containing protein n=1 Tax=Chryseobacterium sp. JK1 TaxID=874294 RepID=UPI003D68F7C7